MSNKTFHKPLAAAIGAALIGTLTAGTAAAADNPFGLKQLDSGYMQTAKEGKCGEAKCGANVKKVAEAKCGDSMKKAAEAKCGDSMKAPVEAKCGDTPKPAPEAKCGGMK